MDNELIRKYLHDQLSAEERNAFEQAMEEDPFLQESVEGFEMAMADHKDWSFENTEISLQKKLPKSTSGTNKKDSIFYLSTFRLAIAASVTGIIAIIIYTTLFSGKRPANEQAIYMAYFKPLTYPDATVRGNADTTEQAKAAQAYEQEDYFAAVKYYEQLVSHQPENAKNNLFLGISLLATNQPKKAIDIFRSIKEPAAYHFDIQWYLALAYLKNKETEQALAILQQLAKEDNYYRQNAADIIAKLEGSVAVKD